MNESAVRSDQSITQLLVKWGSGDKAALDELIPLVYDELRKLAASYLRRRSGSNTLQATALVHEAYVRLADQRSISLEQQRQGAKAVVASLWPVADRSTKLLMQEFYRSRETRKGESKIAALREAQLKLLHGEIALDIAQSTTRQITHEEPQPGEVKRPLFKPDPKAAFCSSVLLGAVYSDR